MAKRVFILVTLIAFVVCAVALAQQRKAIDKTRFGSVEIHQTQRRVMTPSGILVIPWHINYQGYLTDDASNPINDTLSMTFRIYTASAGGSEVWNENHPTVEIEAGLFNEVLGATNPIPDSVFALGQSRWLELAVEAQTMSPRTEITSVGYAYRAVKTDNADEADMVDGFHASASPNPGDLFPLSYGDIEYVNEGQADAVTSNMIQNGEVATMDLANDAVITPKIMDNAITSQKIAPDAVTSQEIGDGTILTADVDPTFKAPYSDTADYALAASVGYVDSAGVSGNSWRLENNTVTDLDGRWVNEGQSDAVTSNMIQNGEVATMDLANDAVITPKIMDNAITSQKIAPDAVTSQEIGDGTILTADVDPTFKAPYSDTADYALEAAADSDWVVSGNYMYPALPGSIGIGTAAPASRLHIIDSGSGILKVNSATTIAGIHIASGGVATNGWSIRSNGVAPSRLEFYDVVQSQTRMVIDNNGNIGINTSVPMVELHLNGNARIDGWLQINGKVISSGGYDPPYVLYDNETRQAIKERVAEEVPEEKSDGAVLFWNGETSQFEVYLPATGEFRDLVGNALANK